MAKSADDVIKEIEAAFLGVPIGQLTLHEADLMDSYATDAELRAARERDPERDWRDVPDASLKVCSYALSYLDPLSWRFYLPALMRYALRAAAEAGGVTLLSMPRGFGSTSNPPKSVSIRWTRCRFVPCAPSCASLRRTATPTTPMVPRKPWTTTGQIGEASNRGAVRGI
jgi:hypothetical protein